MLIRFENELEELKVTNEVEFFPATTVQAQKECSKYQSSSNSELDDKPSDTVQDHKKNIEIVRSSQLYDDTGIPS